jgi:lipopolysaccharide export system protein LptA
MRTSQANRLARWAALAAGAVALVSLGAYGWKQWEARQAQKEAPAMVPPAVQKRSETFSYSKLEGQRTLFTIRASQATEFKEGGKSLLQDVWITIYGKTGKRFDNIHTQECDYQPGKGSIVCAGEVQIDLESAEEAGARPGQRAIRMRTAQVSFDRESGEGRTARPVEFQFAYGAGRGVGLHYITRLGLARLEKDVEVTLAPAPAAGREAAPTKLTGAALEYARDTRTMRLLGPVAAVRGTSTLRAGSLAAQFAPDMRGERLTATGRVELRDTAAAGETTLTADEIHVPLSREGYPERVLASGQVSFTGKDAARDDRLSASRVEMDLADAGRQPQQIRATGAVQVVSQRAGGALRRLESESLGMDFAPAGRARERRLTGAETQAPAIIEFREGDEQSRIRAWRLAAQFDGRSEIRSARGWGGVEVERRIRPRAPQVTASREMTLAVDPRGEWTEVTQSGDVRFREGARSGQAHQARAVRSTEVIALSGGATVADSVSRTAASSIEINQRSGEIVARGNVRTTYLVASPPRGESAFVPNLGPQPAHISAEELRASAEQGRAVYAGKARLWQGDAVLEADTLELRRGAGEERQLLGRGHVRAILPQARNEAGGGSPGMQTVWRARAGQLAYQSSAPKVQLEEQVFAESNVGQLQSQKLDFFLAGNGAGSKQLAKAEAVGDVLVRQGDRRGQAERADYFAGEGKFVLSGGKPTLYDAVLGTTTGRQLTFFLADDRILIDSEEGSRTVTRRRVEK